MPIETVTDLSFMYPPVEEQNSSTSHISSTSNNPLTPPDPPKRHLNVVRDPKTSQDTNQSSMRTSTSTEAYYSALSSSQSLFSEFSRKATTHMKNLGKGKGYQPVHRVPLGLMHVSREYAVKKLPAFNLCGKTELEGDMPYATNGASGDLWKGKYNGNTVAIKVLRFSQTTEPHRFEKVITCRKSTRDSNQRE